MNELMQALTRAATAVAVYYEKQAGVEPGAVVPAAAAPERAPRARKTKAETPAPETAAPAPVPPAPTVALPEMSEEQSAKAVYEVCGSFVQRFAKASPDGRAQALALLASDFKAAAIKDLNHSQRLQFIVKLQGLIAAADKVPA